MLQLLSLNIDPLGSRAIVGKVWTNKEPLLGVTYEQVIYFELYHNLHAE